MKFYTNITDTVKKIDREPLFQSFIANNSPDC